MTQCSIKQERLLLQKLILLVNYFDISLSLAWYPIATQINDGEGRKRGKIFKKKMFYIT